MRRRPGSRGGAWLWLLCCAALAPGRIAEAEDFPIRPIKVIVPFSPGGSTDAFARVVQAEVERQQLLPQPLVIVNMEGAGSAIGSRRVKNARPDGYTLLVLNEAIVTAKYSGSVPYGPEVFEPIAGTGEVGTVITVRGDSPYQSLGELLEDARRRPREVTAAVALGTPSHFAALLVQRALPGAELAFAQIGGGAHRFAALKGGHADVTTFSTDEFRRFRQDGLRGLAYLGPRRNEDIPDVPTAVEQGFDVERTIMLYWWAPKGTPQERLDVIAAALVAAMQSEPLQQQLRRMSVEPVLLRGQALRDKLQRVEAEIASLDPRRESAPDFVGVVLAAVGLCAAAAWWEGRGKTRAAVDVDPAADTRWSPLLACLVLAAGLVLLLTFGWAPLWLSILAFMLASGAALGGLASPVRAAVLVAASVLLAASFHYLFVHVFVVDLP